MALNKFMHPRNIYKTPPDFAKLAKTYEEFSDIAKVDVNGKVSIDFKNTQALRVLTKCLLKSDFNLDVVIPEDRLVPTLPLRLNYILWIEDLMNAVNKNEVVLGLDIGTGACTIYPLLAAVKNKWYMVGTETDIESVRKATDNICRNNLQHLIEVRQNTTKSVIDYLFVDENTRIFDFCMCNPPFYTNIQELWESRSPARPEPKNGFTGSPHELITEGGELQFCRQIIEESKLHKNKILIFTTMVGHKYNLKELVIDLKAEGITYSTTEFCQGRITRWGLAWTYQNFNFSNIFSPRLKSQKKNVPISFVLPELSEFSDSVEKLKALFRDLQIIYKVITKRKNGLTLDVVALSNTWSNQRRKRRIQKRLLEEQVKRPKSNLKVASNISSEQKTDTTNDLIEVASNISSKQKTDTTNDLIEMASNISSKQKTDTNNDLIDMASNMSAKQKKDGTNDLIEVASNISSKQKTDTTNDLIEMASNISSEQKKDATNDIIKMFSNISSEQKQGGTNDLLEMASTISWKQKQNATKDLNRTIVNERVVAEITEVVVHGLLKIAKKDKLLNIEMEFLNGTAGKEGVHQIVQYIKNNWKLC